MDAHLSHLPVAEKVLLSDVCKRMFDMLVKQVHETPELVSGGQPCPACVAKSLALGVFKPLANEIAYASGGDRDEAAIFINLFANIVMLACEDFGRFTAAGRRH